MDNKILVPDIVHGLVWATAETIAEIIMAIVSSATITE